MHNVDFLQDLAVVMIVAAAVTVLFHRWKQPVVLGYIIAGVIIGPHTPPFPLIHDEETIHTLSELGVVFLMFSLGLEFSLRKLAKVGVPALIAALLEILLLFWVGYEIARFFHWPALDRIFLGAMLSMSSTTILIKVLTELGKMKEHFAELIFGILIIEDILGVAMIALLSGIAMTGTLNAVEVGTTLGKLGIFVTVTLVAGLLGIPRLIHYVARYKSNEMLIVTVLGLCFSVSLLAAKLGYSVALGAFIIGAIIAETREIRKVEALLEPVRDMFSAIFFVAIGLMINPAMLIDYWQPVLAITIAVVVGKIVACSFGAFVGGSDTRTSLKVGMGLAQIGEFSFIIAALGVSLKVTSSHLYPIAVAVSAITTLLSPYLIRGADDAVSFFNRVAPDKLVKSLGLYTHWVTQWQKGGHSSLASRLIRRWLWQMGLNIALVAGIFIAAVFLAQFKPPWITGLPGGATEWLGALLWLAAAVLSLPLLVATQRKLQALAMLLGELMTRRVRNEPHALAIRAIITSVISIAGGVAMGLWFLVLSTPLLPSYKILIVAFAVVAFIAWLLRRTFIRAYSQAQIALVETLSTPPPEHVEEPPASLAGLFKAASLETITLTPACAAAGRMIGELALRTRTGASIVAIQRAQTQVVNPGPEEELHAGDQVLVLGTLAQIEAARTHLLATLKP